MNIIPDWRILVIQAGGFILLLIVFKMFLFKPVLDILDARRREIDERYDEAEAQRQAAADLRADYEKHLAEIEEEIRQKITEAVKEGQAMREDILSDSRAQAERILTRAQEEIAREKEKAIKELKTTTADLAVEAAGKLIEERLDSEKHRQLVSRFIDELVEAPR